MGARYGKTHLQRGQSIGVASCIYCFGHVRSKSGRGVYQSSSASGNRAPFSSVW